MSSKLRMHTVRREVGKLVEEASFNLRKDVLDCIRKAHIYQKNKKAKQALGWIIENASIARKEKLAICQDTGLPVVFIEAGPGVSVSSKLQAAVNNAVIESYRKNFLRASVVSPLGERSVGYRGAICHVEFVESKPGLRITVFPKGFGSENKSRLKMFNPTSDWNDVEEFVVDAVKKAGPEACPPFIVGVGVGGTSDYALLLAKKALIERIDSPSENKNLACLEKKLLKRINSLGIGPMGLGGKTTALSVKIKTQPTHIAGLPVGVNISCWALRSASVRILDT